MIYHSTLSNLETGNRNGAALAPLHERLDRSLGEFRDLRKASALPRFMDLPARRDDVALIEEAAVRIRAIARDVVILGTGGSSLGAQTITALSGPDLGRANGVPRLHFPDNLGPFTMERLLNDLELGDTHFLVMSKSGTTAETLAQLMASMAAVRDRNGAQSLTSHFTIIVQPGDNILRRFARRWKLKVLDHDPDLGGRFSALSIVGLLPAAIAGLDILALREGAEQVIEQAFEANQACDVPAAASAAAIIGAAGARGINLNVMMPYECRLERFTAWHQQLWSESLGKSGQGTTPAPALGPVDQHSQLQLYLDGPDDKFYTFITTAMRGEGPVIDAMLASDPELGYMAGRTIGDLVAAEARATMEALIRRGRPVRHISIDALNERSLGALMMHFMLETVFAAALLEVNPYDQPAVEEGKRLTRDYLEREFGHLNLQGQK